MSAVARHTVTGASIKCPARHEDPSGLKHASTGVIDDASRPVSRTGGIRPGWRKEDAVTAGWIDVPVCEAVLAESLKFVCCVDGSPVSMSALNYLADDVLQRDRVATVDVLHLYDELKDYLPASCRREALYAHCETKMASSVSSKRYNLVWKDRKGTDSDAAGRMICEYISGTHPNFACMGYYGLKGKKSADAHFIASHLMKVMRHAICSTIIFKDEDTSLLPIRRKTTFCVSVGLNRASTKAFLDALKLSKPGDDIHVVYIKGYMEDEDSDYTAELREKYSCFFGGLSDGSSKVFHKFDDRNLGFHMVMKHRFETTPQAVVRYADSIDADFIVVGTNSLRVERGKPPVGSVSLQIIQETERNVVVAFWVDVSGRTFDSHVRCASRGGARA